MSNGVYTGNRAERPHRVMRVSPFAYVAAMLYEVILSQVGGAIGVILDTRTGRQNAPKTDSGGDPRYLDGVGYDDDNDEAQRDDNAGNTDSHSL